MPWVDQAALNGDCGVEGVPSIVQLSALDLPPASCCEGGCQIVTYSGVKEFNPSDANFSFIVPFMVIGTLPGSVLVVNVKANLSGPDGFINVFCTLASPGQPLIAIAFDSVAVDPSEITEESWEFSVGWCDDGTFRISFQNGGFTPLVWDLVNLESYMDLPYAIDTLVLFLLPDTDASVSPVQNVHVGCGSLPEGSRNLVMFDAP